MPNLFSPRLKQSYLLYQTKLFVQLPIYTLYGYTKFYSVTAMMTELNLQNNDNLMDKCRSDFQRQIHVYLHLMWLCISASGGNDFMFYVYFNYCLFCELTAWNKDWLIYTVCYNCCCLRRKCISLSDGVELLENHACRVGVICPFLFTRNLLYCTAVQTL